ncbi:cytochrome c oxidase subunit 3 [Kordia sp. YSTF-M3]|uniref:Cytochrome c oxidase subunit 3 n=1 Tax=Kordia aestuariivivens TaxID=2759037 RepID=A0ABR7Q3F8_9FLAO|nr:cytochrome c oxidase subunit 3 [Kordia aestuariivivens]MBC8753090.1 cytochrome c oxidase subunit 3 [Kordia aestuariivivens]
MDLTQGTFQEKQDRSKKMMLWFAMISMFMMFAGLTSAYIVSQERPDWLKDFQMPTAFFLSTLVIMVSSITFYMAKSAIQKGLHQTTTVYLLATLGLGLAFVILQFVGFGQIIESGYRFTGEGSTVTTSFLYIVTFTHILHVFAGILVLLVVIYNHFKQKYKQGQTLGLELGAMFWHFLDFLWVFLFLFLYFLR